MANGSFEIGGHVLLEKTVRTKQLTNRFIEPFEIVGKGDLGAFKLKGLSTGKELSSMVNGCRLKNCLMSDSSESDGETMTQRDMLINGGQMNYYFGHIEEQLY